MSFRATFTRLNSGDHNRRVATLVWITAPILLLSNIAYAAWTVSGATTVTNAAGTDIPLTVAEVAPSGLLYPAGVADVEIDVTNTNSFNITVTDVAFGPVTGGAGLCTAGIGGTALVTFNDVTGLAVPIAPGATATITLPSVVVMDWDSHNDCRGASFSALATVTGASSA